jgi:hypothetical protein
MEESFNPYDDVTGQVGNMWLIFSNFFSLHIQGFVVDYTFYEETPEDKIVKMLIEEHIY